MTQYNNPSVTAPPRHLPLHKGGFGDGGCGFSRQCAHWFRMTDLMLYLLRITSQTIPQSRRVKVRTIPNALAGAGIRHSAPLLLLFQPNPLRWALVGDLICALAQNDKPERSVIPNYCPLAANLQ